MPGSGSVFWSCLKDSSKFGGSEDARWSGFTSTGTSVALACGSCSWERIPAVGGGNERARRRLAGLQAAATGSG
eukprot:scaffold313721_cov30-Tisochrysis_lutea.AAC.3